MHVIGDTEFKASEGVEDEEILLYTVQQDGNKDEAFVTFKINNQRLISFKIDTEAQAKTIPQD